MVRSSGGSGYGDSKKAGDSVYRWSLEMMGKLGRGLLVVCPKCGRLGRLYYSRKIGWYVKHGSKQTHSVPKDSALEIPLHDPRLNLIWYMGGDTFLLPYIAKMIPPHECYVEVFGGGAPLLLNKPPSKVEVYNDIDGNLVNVFRVVKERFKDFMRELDFVLYSRQLYYEFLNGLHSEKDPIKRAVMYFYIACCSFSGKFGKGFGYSVKVNHAREFFNRIDTVLRLIHERLKNVVIEQLDFREIIRRYDSDKTFFYLDPPHIYYGTEKGRDYYVEGFTDEDYMDLLNALADVKGRWLLKQNYVPWIVEWARKNNYSTIMIQIGRSSSLAKEGRRRGQMKVVFVANYKLRGG